MGLDGARSFFAILLDIHVGLGVNGSEGVGAVVSVSGITIGPLAGDNGFVAVLAQIVVGAVDAMVSRAVSDFTVTSCTLWNKFGCIWGYFQPI